MEFTTLGQSNLRVSRVCLGTMSFGTQNNEAEAHAQLDFAREQGVNFIDTAEMYSVPPSAESYGKTERIVGSWLRQQARDQIVIATKIAGPGRTLHWIRNGNLAFNRENIRTALEDSLRRLQTDYVDLYQLHWPDRNTPIFGASQFDPDKERATSPLRETLEALSEQITAGKIRHIGLSNETPWGVMRFITLAEELGLSQVVSVQNAYHLLNRNWEQGLAEIGFRENVSLLAYSPLAFGLLSGKYLDDPQADGRLTRFPGFGQRYAKPMVQEAVQAYVALAHANGVSPTQLALSFVASRWFTASTIIGATTLAQLAENIAACNAPLDVQLAEKIEALHLCYPNPAP